MSQQNLKPGSLALIIHSELPQVVGWIVTVMPADLNVQAATIMWGEAYTKISHPPLPVYRDTESVIPTAWLRPIKGDDDGIDEMLAITGPAPKIEQPVAA